MLLRGNEGTKPSPTYPTCFTLDGSTPTSVQGSGANTTARQMQGSKKAGQSE